MSIISRQEFREEYMAGKQIDLNTLSPEKWLALESAGINRAELERAAGPDKIVRGATEINALFAILDRFDAGDDPIHISIDRKSATTGLREPTVAGRLFNTVLDAVSVDLANQPFCVYKDLDRAAMESHPADWPITLDVPYRAHKPGGGGDCYLRSRDMLDAFDHHARTQLDHDANCHFTAAAEDKHGSISGSTSDFVAGRAYIDYCLEHGRPVIVGASWKDANYNLDGLTDHFLIITGRGVDEQGRVYYQFNDSALSGEHKTGHFYIDKDTALFFRPKSEHPWSYQVSMVRTYKDIDFAAVTGSPATPPH